MDMLFDPAVPMEIRMEDSVRKGYISSKNAKLLAATCQWVDENSKALFRQFPGQAICVVPDRSLERGFATYVSDTGYAAEAKARQFSPGAPFVMLDPGAWAPQYAGLVPPELLLLFDGDDKPNGKPKLDEGGGKKEVGKKEGDQDEAKKEEEEAKANALDKGVSEDTDEELAHSLKVACGKTTLAPFVSGLVQIAKGNCVFKVWAIDSQSTNSSISAANFKRLEKKGAKFEQKGVAKNVQTPNGPADFPKYTGVTMRFPRDDGSGKTEIVTCTEPFIVTTADILGGDQLKATGTRLIWDPASGTAELQKSPKK